MRAAPAAALRPLPQRVSAGAAGPGASCAAGAVRCLEWASRPASLGWDPRGGGARADLDGSR